VRTSSATSDLNRLVDTAAYGAPNFTRPSTVPSRRATVLVSSTVYNDDGTVRSTFDPRGPNGKETRQIYDAAGRVTTTIRNYVNGSPASATSDDDQILRFVYVNGLRTKYWV
jgi:YD repeat-containing protein